MEGQISFPSFAGALAAAVFSTLVVNYRASAEEGELALRRSAQTRDYKGQEYEGEERLINPGDSLWRILVKEKGVPEARFGQALIVVRGLNPQIKQIDVLRVGDRLFIPSQPDTSIAAQPSTGKPEETRSAAGRGSVQEYRVKLGDNLFQILRDQLGIRQERDLVEYRSLVKDLNPERKNWDVLLVGDVIRIPERVRPVEMQTASAGDPAGNQPSNRDKAVSLDPKRLAVRENIPLLSQVIEALGGELQQGGEETLDLKDGTVRLDRASYPVVYNPRLPQKVVLDTEDKIPATLKSRLADPNSPMSIVPFKNGASMQNAVEEILARLGYQPLPVDRPVVIQHGGVSFEAKGDWVALGPEESNKAQEIFVINLGQGQGAIPDYLKEELARQGLQLKDIVLAPATPESVATIQKQSETLPSIRYWPREKQPFVDAVLRSAQIAFSSSETINTQLRDGLSAEVRCDRIFEKDGKRTAIFFNKIDPAFKTALQDREKVRIIEIDLAALDHKSIAARLLSELGDPSKYQEHRFPVADRKNYVQVTAWGFLLQNRGMFITDRDIPPPLYRFFFEKGLEIVYF